MLVRYRFTSNIQNNDMLYAGALGVAICEMDLASNSPGHAIWVLVPVYSQEGNYCQVEVLLAGIHEWCEVRNPRIPTLMHNHAIGIGDATWSQQTQEDIYKLHGLFVTKKKERMSRLYATYKTQIVEEHQKAIDTKKFFHGLERTRLAREAAVDGRVLDASSRDSIIVTQPFGEIAKL